MRALVLSIAQELRSIKLDAASKYNKALGVFHPTILCRHCRHKGVLNTVLQRYDWHLWITCPLKALLGTQVSRTLDPSPFVCCLVTTQLIHLLDKESRLTTDREILTGITVPEFWDWKAPESPDRSL